MRIERTKEWWLAKAHREGNAEVGAGMLVHDTEHTAEQVACVEEVRIAFGRFVKLKRRDQRLSIEKLAEQAELDLGELISIEDDIHYTPDARTVYQLALAFNVPQKRLMQLAGLAVANDPVLRQEAVRFAARSESMQKLTPEESKALENFVVTLGQQSKA